MPSFCIALGCSSVGDTHPYLRFHQFPDPSKDEERRQKWVDALERKNFTPGRKAKLCCLHFKESDYDPPVKITAPKRLRKDAVPSVFPYQEFLSPEKGLGRRSLFKVIPNKVQEVLQEDVDSIPLIREPVSLIEEPFPLIEEPIPLIKKSFPMVQKPIPLIKEPIPLIKERSFKNVEVQTTMTGIELSETIAYFRRERNSLKQKVARLNRRLGIVPKN